MSENPPDDLVELNSEELSLDDEKNRNINERTKYYSAIKQKPFDFFSAFTSQQYQ